MARGQSTKKRREVLLKKFHRLYRPYPSSNKRCIYCGLGIDITRDHVPPLSSLDALGTNYFEDNGLTLWLVNCCRQCNMVLGATEWLHTISERRNHIAAFIKRRYKKQLDGAAWSMDELEQLGIGLRNYVEAKSDQHTIARRRLIWATGF